MKQFIIKIVFCLFVIAILYGSGRLYYRLTDGFLIENISSKFVFHPEWETRALTFDESQLLDQALNQNYSYLGKGCQSYVFQSEDGMFVIKFFKYQRYRLQFWFNYLPSWFFIEDFKRKKLEKKQLKLEKFFLSWKVAFDQLKNETGLVYVHLNKTSHLNRHLIIFDKMKIPHVVDLDQMEFCVQYKAEMLEEAFQRLKQSGNLQEAKELITKLVLFFMEEFKRGFSDNDPALMQNTGVLNGLPIHIDIGQLQANSSKKDRTSFLNDLLNKINELKVWLQANYPEAVDFADSEIANYELANERMGCASGKSILGSVI